MSDAERQRTIDALVESDSLEEQAAREAMAESDEHYDAKEETRATLRRFFSDSGRRGYVGAERTVFYPGEKGFTPDIIAILDVSPHKRTCWMVSQEGRGVDVIIEIFVQGDWRKDYVDNVRRYAELGVPEYFIFDVRRAALTAYRRDPATGAYQPIQRRLGAYPSERLGLALTVRRRRLRFLRDGALLRTPDELLDELGEAVEAETQRAEDEARRAEEAIQELRDNLIGILEARGLGALSPEQAATLAQCSEPAHLRRLFQRALRATTIDSVFAAD